MERFVHPFEPIYNSDSEILILGSFPSVKSREDDFYYAHKRNRFWPMVADIFNEPIPHTVAEKKALLLHNKVALWDVAAECTIRASSDSSIKNVIPNNITELIAQTHIGRIFANGKTAEQLYNKHILPLTDIAVIGLPSTSPANAAFTAEMLKKSWRIIAEN